MESEIWGLFNSVKIRNFSCSKWTNALKNPVWTIDAINMNRFKNIILEHMNKSTNNCK